jgi:Fur family ferric uptake transcriptional regulator
VIKERDNVAEDQEIRKAGLKVTVPRLKILQILEQNCDRHLSAEDVYKLLLQNGDDIGLATVYRVLTQFESAGLLNRHNFEGGFAVFKLDQGEHHDHLICVNCGRVEEFVDEVIEKRQLQIAKKLGFSIEDHTLVIYGRCDHPDCQGNN